MHDGRVTRRADALASTPRRGGPDAGSGLAERKEALEGFVHSSLESAEELARLHAGSASATWASRPSHR